MKTLIDTSASSALPKKERRSPDRHCGGNAAPPAAKAGQTLIFMTMVVVMLAFAALLYFDVHKILHVKAISRNAGDAAALAGARWQAISLNLIGDLNVAQALAHIDSLAAGQPPGADSEAIEALQRRIAFSGPVFGFMAAQQAAKNNGIFNQPRFSDSLRSHVAVVESEYVQTLPEPFSAMPPYTNGWMEYADMLRVFLEQGLAVDAGWTYFGAYANMNHLLLTPEFYDAIAGRSWCWFYSNAMNTLQNYTAWTDWEALPPILQAPPVNAEVFGLHLQRLRVLDSIPVPVPGLSWEETFGRLRALRDEAVGGEGENVVDYNANWAYYSGRWATWTGHMREGFPWDGDIRSEFDYGGADAAVQISTGTRRRSVPAREEGNHADVDVHWTAGAKPFGSLDARLRPNAFGLVLPAFTDIRLIPVDATLSAGGGMLRPGWLEFIMVYLPEYMAQGPSALPPGNWFAEQLLTWEQAQFRERGIQWLLANSASCFRPTPGPGSSGSGGTAHGH